jgi:hypothetical protein
MLKSVLRKLNKIIVILFVTLSILTICAFGSGPADEQLLLWGNNCLMRCFDPTNEIKIKKWELQLTPEGFFRLRKTYHNGKQEYYSLHLKRLDEMNYLGTTAIGILQLKATGDDIIVQTYDDPKGDIDSMSNMLNIPVKNMEPQQVDSLRATLLYLKAKNL